MADRLPFEMPSGCPEVTFDPKILPSRFSLCSTPVFTNPTAFIPPIPVPYPIFTPPLCPCLPTIRMTMASKNILGSTLNLDIKILPINKDQDCCGPDTSNLYRISYKLDVPCVPRTMPIVIQKQGTQFTFAVRAQRLSNCDGFKFSYKIHITCFPLTILSPIKMSNPANPANPSNPSNPDGWSSKFSKPRFSFVLFKLPNCSGLKFSYTLAVPCFPKRIQKSTAMASSTDYYATPRTFLPQLDLVITKMQNCSGLRYSYSLNVPCYPKQITVVRATGSAYSWPEIFTTPKMEIKATKLSSCEGLKFSYKFDVPCFPKQVIKSDNISPGWPDSFTTPNLDLQFIKLEQCEGLKFSYKLDVPCFPKQVIKSSAATSATHVWPTLFTSPRLDLKFTKMTQCSGLKFSYKLDVPCFPNQFNVEQNIVYSDGSDGLPISANLEAIKLPNCEGLKLRFNMRSVKFINSCLPFSFSSLVSKDSFRSWPPFTVTILVSALSLPKVHVSFGPNPFDCKMAVRATIISPKRYSGCLPYVFDVRFSMGPHGPALVKIKRDLCVKNGAVVDKGEASETKEVIVETEEC